MCIDVYVCDALVRVSKMQKRNTNTTTLRLRCLRCLCLHNNNTLATPPPRLTPTFPPSAATLTYFAFGQRQRAVVKRRNFCVYGAKLRNEQNSTTRTTTTKQQHELLEYAKLPYKRGQLSVHDTLTHTHTDACMRPHACQ